MEDIRPYWVQRAWEHYCEPLVTAVGSGVDIVFFGNTGSAADLIIPEAASLFKLSSFSNKFSELTKINDRRNIAVVMDLAARIESAHELMHPHALIGPSHYAICEYQRLISLSSKTLFDRNKEEHTDTSISVSVSGARRDISPNSHLVSSRIPSFLVTPGVDMNIQAQMKCPIQGPRIHNHYNKHNSDETTTTITTNTTTTIKDVILSRAYHGRNRCNDACVVIGFVGRLAKMKSSALFLATAQLILASFPNAVFLVAGTGWFMCQDTSQSYIFID